MIISTIIVTICFILVVFELYSMYKLFKSCCTVKCTVVSSKKIIERHDGFLTDEYWKTDIVFNHNSKERHSVLKTSTYCQKGQIIGCYYNPQNEIIFRKRDIKKQIKNSSIIITTIGILFMVLDCIFSFSLAGISKLVLNNLTSILSVLLIIFFFTFGIGYVLYALNAIKNTSKKRVTVVEAEITDIVRKSKKHHEKEQFTYYPIYSYVFKGEPHETRSKLKHSYPPKKGSKVLIAVDNRKSGPVEYNDVFNSLFMGICFIIFSILFYYVFAVI